MTRFVFLASIFVFPIFLLSSAHGGGYVPPTPLAGLGGAVIAASRYQHAQIGRASCRERV
jgi:hypothetical protein